MRRDPAFSDLEGEYRRYLADVRGLSPATIKNRLSVFRRFGAFLKRSRIRTARRVSLDVAYAFLQKHARAWSRRSTSAVHGWIRCILRFLYFARILSRDISKEMIGPRIWSLADVPGTFSDRDVTRMLAAFRTDTPYDYRERAVILLFVFYGLRLGEVAGIGLDDIDWRSGIIGIRERKNRLPLDLPLLPPVESALRDYLVHARSPEARSGKLFVVMYHRHGTGLTTSTIRTIVKDFLRRLGLKGSANTFRHTFATRLINNGASLKTIADLLGHGDTDSALVYAKLHLEALREVADNYSLEL